MFSMMNEPVTRKPRIGPAAVSAGISELRSTWTTTTRRHRKPLRLCSAHVVLLECLEHLPAHQSYEVGEREETERNDRQNLRCGGVPAVRREDPPLRREEIDEQRRREERGDREAEVRDDLGDVVRPPVDPQRGDDPERNADKERQQHREAAELCDTGSAPSRCRSRSGCATRATARDRAWRRRRRSARIGCTTALFSPNFRLRFASTAGGTRTLALSEWTALDRPHHPERHEHDEEDDRNRPEDATDDELQHLVALLPFCFGRESGGRPTPPAG